ncbi:unnamed protein product [Paramecium sonneborni]|uniref:Transmembrane protein n=1 Tax=Paramecium sonneborni TaxID=65129 RepID=A0A8S1RTG5_9CILI|nr:unnamed protein product [Paramecium sonneborni]
MQHVYEWMKKTQLLNKDEKKGKQSIDLLIKANLKIQTDGYPLVEFLFKHYCIYNQNQINCYIIQRVPTNVHNASTDLLFNNSSLLIYSKVPQREQINYFNSQIVWPVLIQNFVLLSCSVLLDFMNFIHFCKPQAMITLQELYSFKAFRNFKLVFQYALLMMTIIFRVIKDQCNKSKILVCYEQSYKYKQMNINIYQILVAFQLYTIVKYDSNAILIYLWQFFRFE